MSVKKFKFATACVLAAAMSLCSAKAAETPENFEGSVICAYHRVPHFKNVVSIADATPEAIKAVNWIADKIGITKDFRIHRAKFSSSPIAFAALRDGERFIVYDEDFFVSHNNKTPWHDIGIFAHEVGHHIQGHTAQSNLENWPQEIAADRFAGFAVSRLGGSLENALAMSRSLSEKPSDTHPSRAIRKKAIEEGWRHGEAMKKREVSACGNGWQGKEIDIDGSMCRIARQCVDGKPLSRIACRDFEGAWKWMGK